MLIANPIYDVVFKRLLENERVAKFFISTLLDQHIESVEVRPQEFTYEDEHRNIAVLRLDFLAVVRTAEGGHQKVLIEIQKARNRIDVMRFRNYLAEQYKREDKVGDARVVLPITTIYMLGFNIPEIETACVHVNRQYRDLINARVLDARSSFIERLTHDSYIVQLRRIEGRYQSKLDKLLSVFEQANFVDESQIIKEYAYPTEEGEVRLMTDILHRTVADPETRQQIENEREAWRSFYALFGEELSGKDEIIAEQERTLAEQRRLIEELQKRLDQEKK